MAYASITDLTTQYIWDRVKVGGGGFKTGQAFSADGNVHYVRSDVFGFYRRLNKTGNWQQLCVPAAFNLSQVTNMQEASPGYQGGWEVCPSQQNPDLVYIGWDNRIWKSTNARAATPTFTPLNFAASMTDGNAQSNYGSVMARLHQKKMAVDPANDQHLIVPTVVESAVASNLGGGPATGGQGKTYRSIDGGATVSHVASLPASSSSFGQIGPCVVFDPSGGLSSGRTAIAYVMVQGVGLHKTTNGGTTFAAVSATGTAPTRAVDMAVGDGGRLYVITDDKLYRLYAGAWTVITMSSNRILHAVECNPADKSRVVVTTDDGVPWQFKAHGDTAPALSWGSIPQPRTVSNATDIPWLGTTNNYAQSNSGARFMPGSTDVMCLTDGIGVWLGTVDANRWYGTNGAFHWTSITLGIEDMVATAGVHPAAGQPVLMTFWDRYGVAQDDPEVPVQKHMWSDDFNARSKQIVHSFSVDYCKTQPQYVAVCGSLQTELGGMSSDGGLTFDEWAVYPFAYYTGSPVGLGQDTGQVAVDAVNPNVVLRHGPQSDANWNSFGVKPRITTNGGASWSNIGTPPGWTDSSETWLTLGANGQRRTICADGLTGNRFYMYSRTLGLVRSDNAGTSWTQKQSAVLNSGAFSVVLKEMPNVAGYLLLTDGHVGGTTPSGPLYRTLNGFDTMAAVPDVLEVTALDYGIMQGNGFRSIFFNGAVNITGQGYVEGYWRTDDNFATIKKLGGVQPVHLERPTALIAIKTPAHDGQVWSGSHGSSFIYGRLATDPMGGQGEDGGGGDDGGGGLIYVDFVAS